MRRILLFLLLGCSAETETEPELKPAVSTEPGYTWGELCDASSAAICQAWSVCGALEPNGYPAAWGDPAECVALLRSHCCPRGGPGWLASCDDAPPVTRAQEEACLAGILAQSCDDLAAVAPVPSCS